MSINQAHAGEDADFDVGDQKAASISSRGRDEKTRGLLSYMPLFVWVSLIGIGLRFYESVSGERILNVNIIPVAYGWEMTLISVVMGLLAVTALHEVYHVSKPGVNQSNEITAIAVLGVLQLILFALGAYAQSKGDDPWLHVFASSESAIFAVVTLACAVYAYLINVRSMQRSFVNGS